MADIPVPTTTSTTPDSDCLAGLELRITTARKAGIEVGRALDAIKRGTLYRTVLGIADFDTYAFHRWGYKRAYAYRLIQAASIVDQLVVAIRSTNVDLAARLEQWGNVHAALALEGVSKGQRVAVIEKAYEVAGGAQPSRSHLRFAIAEILGRKTTAREDERTARFHRGLDKIAAVIRCVRDRSNDIDRVAIASTLDDALRLLRERRPKRNKEAVRS